MTDIQAELLKIAKYFADACEKMGLTYFLFGGTALGAARHKGFIPWDDDMDFVMPRKDYEEFEKNGQKFLPKFLFVQTKKTDKKWFSPFMKIRNSNTTAVERIIKNRNVNHGLWIDVFPMDGLPSNKKKVKLLSYIDSNFLRRRYMFEYYQKGGILNKLKNIFSIIICPSKNIAFKLSEKMSKKYKFENSKYVWFNWGNRVLRQFPKSFFEERIEVPFEDTTFKMPFCFDDYLTFHYGNWHKLPPEEKRKPCHCFSKLDLQNAYTLYLK